MADVFLSYARGDRALAERIANAIGEAGLTVWWDRHIKGGAEFSRDIEQQLNEASKVLVLWSREAAESRWVRDEAGVAADSGRLVSATIDGTPPPLGFRQFQTINLKSWTAKGAAIPSDLAEALEVERPVRATTPYASPRRSLLIASVSALFIAGAATVALVRPEAISRMFSGDEQSAGVSLAIMPFVTSAGADVQFLGPALSTTLTDSLAPLSGLKIIASTSTQAIARKDMTAPEIGKALGISHLIEGDVQKQGDRYSISARLIEAKTSEQIWGRSFAGPSVELQSIKNRLARELASALRARLGVGNGDIAVRRDVDPAAFEAYLRALERVSVRDERDSRVEAIKQFRLAASLQPDFTDAHAGHAYLLALSLPDQLNTSWPQLMADQSRAAQRALKLDPDHNLALIAKATALQNFHGDAERASAIGRAVLKRSPNFGPAHYSMAASLWMAARPRQALEHVDKAIDLDPFDNNLRFYRALILYALGDYEGVRDAAAKCPAPCIGMGYAWFLALAAFATPDQFREDMSGVTARGRAEGIPEEDLAEGEKIAEALVYGREYKAKPLEDDGFAGFVDAALEARVGRFEDALRIARTATERHQADNVLGILNAGRVSFTAEQRADPRYHQLFRHPKIARIANTRRRLGVTAGLPVFPVKPYTGR